MLPDSWSPEHLVLAGLVRCTLTSLAYHARRLGLGIQAAGSASGLVTRRESDGRYAFAEIGVELTLELESPLASDQLCDLLAKAERDCFVGASLRVSPRYRWTVDGVAVSAPAEPS
jgi:organic hydroperoxide reductase OsmC/OhrA